MIWSGATMLRVELATHLRRMHTLIVFAVLVAVPSAAAATETAGRGHADTFSALNFTESGLNFMDPVLFGVVVAVFGSILGGSDREWGTLRYLYTRPVSRVRLVAGKACGLAVCTLLAVGTFLVVALLAGYAAFGWHPFRRAGADDLSAARGIWALAGAAGYLALCLLSLGAIALALGLLLPRAVEAVAVSIAFLIGATMIDGVRALHGLVVVLPIHYWMRWTELFDPHPRAGDLVLGLAVQGAATALAIATAHALLGRRDPAA